MVGITGLREALEEVRALTGRSDAGLSKRIDYSTDKDSAKVYLKKYRVTQAPALLFLDPQGNLLWMRAGELKETEIADKLSQFGG